MITGADGSITEVPRDEYCWPCGVAFKCWPNDEFDDLLEKYETHEPFKLQVQNVREGVLRCRQQLEVERTTVDKRVEVCTRMVRRYNFVYAVPFSKYFGVPLDQITDMCVQMRTPDYDYAEGVLIRGSVPDDLEHDQVEISTSMSRTKVDELASADTCLRKGQAKERFEGARSSFLLDRPVGMKPGANARRPLTFADLKSKVEAEDAKRIQAEAAAAAAGAAGGAGTVSVSTSRFGDDDDDDAMCAPAAGVRKSGPGGKIPAAARAKVSRATAAAAAAAKNAVPGSAAAKRRLPVRPVPVFSGASVTALLPGLPATASPGLGSLPGTPAFSLIGGGPRSVAGTVVGGGDSAVDLMSCDAGTEAAGDACEAPAAIHDMMNLRQVIVEMETIDKRKLRKASLG